MALGGCTKALASSRQTWLLLCSVTNTASSCLPISLHSETAQLKSRRDETMESMKEYLLKRELNTDLHRPVVDEEERTVTFYLWNPSGQLAGYQQNRPDQDKSPQKLGPKMARYFTYRKQPTVSFWGVESLYAGEGPVFLCEGVYDASRLTWRGCSALAACCNNPSKDFANWLGFLARPVVVVCDDDLAGRKLAKFGDYVEVAPHGGDLGEAPEEYVNWLVSKYT